MEGHNLKIDFLTAFYMKIELMALIKNNMIIYGCFFMATLKIMFWKISPAAGNKKIRFHVLDYLYYCYYYYYLCSYIWTCNHIVGWDSENWSWPFSFRDRLLTMWGGGKILKYFRKIYRPPNFLDPFFSIFQNWSFWQNWSKFSDNQFGKFRRPKLSGPIITPPPSYS